MPDRSWFYADRGQQQGPFPEAQLRSLIANGTVRADTLIWTEGMANWQRAGEIPGLMSRAAGPPPVPGPTLLPRPVPTPEPIGADELLRPLLEYERVVGGRW